MADLVILTGTTARKRLTAVIEQLFAGITATAASGSYRSPKHSALLQAVDNLPKGLVRARHLQAFIRVAEANRTPAYEPAAGGSYEPSFNRLTQAFPLPDLNAFLTTATLDRFIALFSNATYTA